MDEDDFGPDACDRLFDELDRLVVTAKEAKTKLKASVFQHDASLEMINLMMEELPENTEISQREDDNWEAKVEYHGITFVCVAGKRKPQFWDEVFEDK